LLVFARFRRPALSALVWTLLFASALALTYWRVISAPAGSISGRYDVYRYFGPNAFYMDTAIHHGEFPLWNPLVYCGMPFAANPQTAAFYPPNIARSLLNFNPTPRRTLESLVVLMALHLLLAAAGTYRLARAHALSRPAAYAAAVAFTFSALMTRRACEFHFLYTLNWLPWILLLVKHTIDRTDVRAKLLDAAAAGALLGLAILGGFLQIIPYMLVAIAAYAAACKIVALRAQTAKRLLTDFAALILAAAVTAALAAVLIVPAAELAAHAARQPDAPIGQYSNLSKAGIGSFLQNLVLFAGMRYQAEAVRGSGAAALILVIAALVLRPRRDAIVFLIPWLLLVDCSFGPPMPVATLVQRLTPFATSASTRAYDVALLPLSILAGLGVDALATPRRSTLLAAVRTAIIAIAGAAVLITLAQKLELKPFLPVSTAALIVPAAALAIIAAAPWLASRKNLLASLQLILPLLIFSETLTWNRHYVPWLLGAGIKMPHANAQWPPPHKRFVDSLANNALYGLKPLINGYDPLHLRKVRNIISGPPRDRSYHRLVIAEEPIARNQRGNLFLKRPFWLLKSWAPGPLPPKDSLFPAATTVFLDPPPDIPVPQIAPAAVPQTALSSMGNLVQNIPITTPEIPAGSVRNLRIKLDLPPAHCALVLKYQSTCRTVIETSLADRDAPYAQPAKTCALTSSSGNTRSVEIPLPDIPHAFATLHIQTSGRSGKFNLLAANVYADPDDAGHLIRNIVWRANSARLTVADAPGNRVLLFTDAGYPGWKAFLDSAPVPIYRANDAFKAVLIPPGTHSVKFVFRPTTLYAAAIISLATALTLLLASLYRSDRSDPSDS